MSSPSTPAHTLNLIGVLSESKKIINSHSRHFLALSLIFLLPLSFSLIIFPTLSPPQNDIVSTQFIITPVNNPLPNHPHIHIYIYTYILYIYISLISATATITYSTFHGFYGRPVKVFPALKSLFFTFFPLLSTVISAQLILFLIVLSFGLFITVFVKLSENLGFVIDYGSFYFTVVFAILVTALALLLLYFVMTWSLAFVIVVAEWKWGFAPLRRSSYLVKGMRSVSLSVILLFGGLIGVWVWMNSNDVLHFDVVDGWRSWPFVLQLVIGTSMLTLFLLHSMSANTVLYMYCKALHGELAIEIAQEFAREYVSLPFDDDKVPHVVTVFPA
uniref:uncharacterized protein LOC122578818 n=1 Tax=Erigeron canadensis TaxID=72917 RepID=UPI001CB9083C|nr:uncharacterized protein LOC122578818 [Erigeron canadensis]